MTLLEQVEERYFQKKASLCNVSIECVKERCNNRLPSDQMIALIEVLEREKAAYPNELKEEIDLALAIDATLQDIRVHADEGKFRLGCYGTSRSFTVGRCNEKVYPTIWEAFKRQLEEQGFKLTVAELWNPDLQATHKLTISWEK